MLVTMLDALKLVIWFACQSLILEGDAENTQTASLSSSSCKHNKYEVCAGWGGALQ